MGKKQTAEETARAVEEYKNSTSGPNFATAESVAALESQLLDAISRIAKLEAEIKKCRR
jgi:hypothetical protein